MTVASPVLASQSRCVWWMAVLFVTVTAPCHAAGPSPLFGLAILLHRLAVFVGVQIAVATTMAIVAKRGSRRRVFLLSLAIWPAWCFAVAWGPPLVEVLWAALRGDTWSSYTEPYPGHVRQYLRYVLINRFPPTPSVGVAISSVAAAILIVLIGKIKRRVPAG